jgi:putative ABC transport system permease protein
MAVAFVLLIGSALLINSFWRLSRVDPGFATSNVLRVSLLLPESRYPRDFQVYPRWPEVHQFNERLLRTLSDIPGIQDVALAVSHPLDGGFTNSFRITGRESEAASQPEMPTRLVSPDYFRTMSVPLVAGRGFEDRDHAESPLVMLINQAAADRFFPDDDAIGSRITFWGMEREVVGIVGNERFYGLAEDTPAAMYGSTSQAPPVGGEVLLVRTAGDPLLVVNAVRQAIWEQDADLAIFNVATLDETLAESLATERFTTVLLLVFGGVALILALVGVYGVLAYLVARRRHEIGVRLAIGASSEEIVRMVLRQGMVLALVGMFLGVTGAVALSGSLRSLLFEISPLDPATYVMAATGLVVAAGMACLMPALRASRVDPVEAMRTE